MDLTKKDFFDLDLIGAHPTEEPFVLIVQITTVGLFLRLFYFDFFLYDDERSLAVCSEAIESKLKTTHTCFFVETMDIKF